jgi:hypothetical protein
MGSEWTAIGNFGFAIVAAVVLWAAYQKLIPALMDVNKKLLEVVQQNSIALTRTAEALAQVVEGQREESIRLGRMDDRLLVLEKRHEGAIRECPYSGKEERD